MTLLRNNDTLPHMTRFLKVGHLVLVSCVLCILGMIFLPLPSSLLDFFLSVNLIGVLTLLILVLSITDNLKLSTFPTILLVATLFRLGLNISSTRLILSEGYAGELIQTFGYVVTKGNMTVGLILFLIITVIQFIVIAKGAERVAEVSARFTLDALPGKQMSIDADLRAGLLTQEEAQEARALLQQESQLYGAMDGAMKFVKGDAIAGLLITFINLLGGLFTGVVQHQMELSRALLTYSTLTVGDGLISQIPALLMALTASMIVTRVSNDRHKQALGHEISFQLLAQPKILLQVGGIAFILGLIPGFPFIFFLLISIILISFATTMLIMKKMVKSKPIPIEHYQVTALQERKQHLGFALPLILEVGPRLFQQFQNDPRWNRCLGPLYQEIKSQLSLDMGLPFPDIHLSVQKNLGDSLDYQILLFEIPIDSGRIFPDTCIHIGHLEQNLAISASLSDHTVHGTPITSWPLNQKKTLRDGGIPTLGPEEMLLRHLALILKKNAAEFFGIQEMQSLLTKLDQLYPDLVHEVVPKLISLQKLTEITRRLLQEGVPIKDYRLILQILSTCQPDNKDPITLTEQVRMGLKRTISHLYSDEENRLHSLTLDPDIEQEIDEAIEYQGQECYLSLSPERLSIIVSALQHKVKTIFNQKQRFVLITNSKIRSYVRRLISDTFPLLPVLSYYELTPHIKMNHLGSVSLKNQD